MSTINSLKSDRKSNLPFLVIAAGFTVSILVASIAMNIKGIAQPLGLLQQLLVVILAAWHCVRRYGLKGLAVFFLAAEIISNAIENLSISTGFPFGHYHYTPGTPFLFQVPIIVGLAYFAYGYLAWTIANILLGRADERIQTWAYAIVLPLTAAFIMVMWDVVMDPISSTVRRFWIWENGGGFNGVPLTNYLGWFLTVYLIYQVFALYVGKHISKTQQQTGKIFWATPVILYLVTGISYICMYFFASQGVAIDATGHAWNIRGIYETAAIVSLYTMVFVGLLAFVQVLRREETR